MGVVGILGGGAILTRGCPLKPPVEIMKFLYEGCFTGKRCLGNTK